MSPQADYVVANGTGAAVRSDINGQLSAIVSQNSGATEPATMYAYQWWADSTTGLLKIRNAANNAWVTVGTLASANLGLATLASPTLTGTPAAPTATAGTNTTQIATTAFVAASFAPVASPTLTGTPAAPTASAGTNTTQLATTAYVVSQAIAKTGGTMTGDLVVPSLNGGPIAGSRNRIINGSLDFWQRGTSTTATGNTYLADRWASAFATGGTVSQETSSLPTGSRYAWKFVASASNSFMQMGQAIEYANCLDLQNTTVSISFMARAVNTNAGSTALTVRTRTIAGVDGACLFAGSNADSSVTLTTTWTRYTFTRTLPATFGSLSLEFSLGSHVSGDGIMLSQIQLEPGSTATLFERRSYGQELALCQRYFQKSYDQTTVPGTGTTTGMISHLCGTNGTAAFYNTVQFGVLMRSAPSITTYDTAGTSGKVYRGVNGKTAATLYISDRNATIGTDDATSAIGFYYQYTASAEL